MHSSSLRGSDFHVEWRGATVPHSQFFSFLRDTDRLGVVAPRRLDGLGALTLILACVTAFYDRYRERGAEFFAYPDYFTFQHEAPAANYGMCDIWPARKNACVPADAQATLEAITDRGVTVLLAPQGPPGDPAFAPVELVAARRTLRRCFAYSATGIATAPDLILDCAGRPLSDYALAVVNSVPADPAAPALQAHWQAQADAPLRQSFREITVEAALRLLRTAP